MMAKVKARARKKTPALEPEEPFPPVTISK
jgi:hypothetical protein